MLFENIELNPEIPFCLLCCCVEAHKTEPQFKCIRITEDMPLFSMKLTKHCKYVHEAQKLKAVFLNLGFADGTLQTGLIVTIGQVKK